MIRKTVKSAKPAVSKPARKTSKLIESLKAAAAKTTVATALDKEPTIRALRSELDKALSRVNHGTTLETEKQLLRLQTANAELKAKNSHLSEQAASADKRADLLLSMQGEPALRKWEKLKKAKQATSTPIIVLSDWHAEERVDSDTIDGMNHFDLDVASRRIKETFRKAVYLMDFVRGVADIKDLVLAIIGDMVAGYIHEELRESNYLSPGEAVLFVQDHIHNGIQFLLKEGGVKSITLPCCHGNHGRTNPQKPISTSYKNSFEWNMYHQLERLYRNEPRVAFKIEKGIHNWLPVQGRAVRFHHGDNIRYAGGVGGITIPVNKKIAQWNKARVADLDIFGHYHAHHDYWKWVCNGCLVGYNLFATAVGAEFQPPTQTLVVVSKRYGKVMALPIFCE